MIKKIFSLFAAILFAGSMWAAEVTYSLTPDATSTGSSATGYQASLSFTYEGVSWTMAQINPSTLQTKTNQTNPTAEFNFHNTSAFPGRITQVVVKYKALTIATGKQSEFMFLGGTSAVTETTGGTSGTWNSTDKTFTWTPAANTNYTYFAYYMNGKTATGSNYLAESDAIVVTYETSGGGKTLTSIAVSGTPTKTSYYAGDNFDPAGLTVTGTYSDKSTAPITSGITWSYDPSQELALNQTSIGVIATVNEIASPKFTVTGLTVTEAPAVATYEKVTSTEDITDGEYLIVYESGNVALNGALTSLDAVGNTVAVTINEGVIEGSDAIDAATVTINTTAKTIQTASGYYIGVTSYSNGLSSSTSNAYEHQNISIDGGNAVIYFQQESWNSNKNGKMQLCYNSGSDQRRFRYFKEGSQKAIQLYKKAGAPAAVEKPAISGETSFFTSTEVSITCATDGAKIYYTLDGSEPSSASTQYTAPFSLTETKTVKAIAILGDDESEIATKTFTKAPVYASIEALVAAGLATGSKMTVSFEDKEITDVFVYSETRRGIYLNVKAQNDKDVEIYYGADAVPAEWVIGGTVSGTIQGTWTLYSGQWEIVPTKAGWTWADDLTYNAPAVAGIVITSAKSIEAPAAGTSGKIDVQYNNIADLSSAAVVFYTDAEGTETTTCSWVTPSFDSDKNVEYVVAANTGDARSAYLKVQVGDVKSDIVTISQAKYVAPYATLPFAFDGGQADIASKNGLTEDGIATKDYASSPKLKFDGTGDYLILQINEAASLLTFDINGNGFSGGTFKVQTSADGIDYDDLETYTELGATQSEMFNIDADVRFIKWIYVNKSSGNVGLGNITLSKHTYTLQWSIGTSVEPLGTMLLQGESSSYKVEFALKDVRANTYKVEVFQEGVAEHVGVANLEIAEDGKYYLRFIFDSSEKDPTKALDIDTNRKGDATSFDNTVDGKKAVKFIQNGQLFIEMNGRIYNVQGQTVK